MALKLTVKTPQNYEAEYWRIFSITNSSITNGSAGQAISSITLELWKDKDTREAVINGEEWQPVKYESIQTPIQTSIESAYEYLKTLDRFKDAVDA